METPSMSRINIAPHCSIQRTTTTSLIVSSVFVLVHKLWFIYWIISALHPLLSILYRKQSNSPFKLTMATQLYSTTRRREANVWPPTTSTTIDNIVSSVLDANQIYRHFPRVRTCIFRTYFAPLRDIFPPTYNTNTRNSIALYTLYCMSMWVGECAFNFFDVSRDAMVDAREW